MTTCDELTSQRGGHTTGCRKTIECENIWNQLWKLLRISSLSSELFKNPELVIKVEIKQIKHEHQPQGKQCKGCWSYHCHILPNPVNNRWHRTEHKAPWQKLQRGMLRIVRQATWIEHPDPTWLTFWEGQYLSEERKKSIIHGEGKCFALRVETNSQLSIMGNNPK